MEANNKAYLNKIRAFSFTGLASLIVLLVFLFCKDSMIVMLGIRTLAFLKKAFIAAFGISIGCDAFYIKKRYFSGARKRITQDQPVAVIEDKPLAIREELKKHLNAIDSVKHEALYNETKKVFDSLDKIDDHQARLHELLKNNDADALNDTEDILSRVEENICGNIRRFINQMTILDYNEDNDTLVEKAIECDTANTKLLDSSKDFMLAISDYINKQAGDDDLSDIELYKNAILKQMSTDPPPKR